MALTDDAVERIKRRIVDGSLRPGDKLPPEQELADELGISKGSLRAAVRALTVMRVLDPRQGDGTYVTSLAPALLIDVMSFVIDFQRDETLLHFFHVRRVLEAEAAASAALAITPEDLVAIDDLIKDAERLASAQPVDHEAMIANDQDFHRRITGAGGNPVLAAVVESMSGQTTRARIWRGLADENAAARTVQEHRAIYEALRDRDPDRARLRAAVHVCGVEDWLRARLQSENTPLADTLSHGSGTPLDRITTDGETLVH